jgi:UDP-N-acetyl-D-mannosaminuronic acid dehydrogenase
MNTTPDVVIVGVGYVGLTLAATLADQGFHVIGYDHNADVVASLREGRPQLYEPGLEDILQTCTGKNLLFETTLPEQCHGVTIICVSTPVGEAHTPNLDNLRAATTYIADHVVDDALVIVRSTVPVGTTRTLVLPIFEQKNRSIRLAHCPERTIQGQAIEEIRHLPQIVGGLNQESLQAAVDFWKLITAQVVPVSSCESSELIKLINNIHTDVLYSFGNEVAMMAHQFHLDPLELIHAANMDYPRPDLARPGFVSGPCLSKDSYLLKSSFGEGGYVPPLVSAARTLNESLPATVAQHLITMMEQQHIPLEEAKVLICGFAFKGWPVTDDTRGTPTIPLIQALQQHPLRLYGHDYMVQSDQIRACGAEPVETLEEGIVDAHAVVFVNEHPDYRQLDIERLTKLMKRPAVVYDSWRMFRDQPLTADAGIHEAGIGYG